MENNLKKDCMMACPHHGFRRPAFICKHLQYGEDLGLNMPDEPPEPEWPFENAWCDQCDKFLQEESEWNDRSESIASIIAVCEGCLKEIKKWNTKH